MDTVIHKVRQLIGMTGSSNVEEARSMAIAACHMILKEKLVVCRPEDLARAEVSRVDPFSPSSGVAATGAPPPPRKAPERPKKPWRGPDPFLDETGSTPTPSTSGKGRGKSKHWERGDAPVRLTNRYPAFCKGCGVHCEPGETIYWRREKGVCCKDCGPEPLKG
jgi:hypothetical protein